MNDKGRRHWADNLRWITVMLVVAYHVAYLFNGAGIPGSIPGAASIPLFDWLAALVYPWFMVLLFVLAGMSSAWALEKKTIQQFVKERTVKLLVPSTLGLFAWQWVTGWLNIKMGGGLSMIPGWLLYPICAISGTGPLWFVQLLWLYSMLLALLCRLHLADRLLALGNHATLPVAVILGLLIWAASFVGNLPVLTMYRIGIYLVSFFTGWMVFSHSRILESLKHCAWWFAAAACGLGIWYGLRFAGTNFTADVCLQSPVTNAYAWAAVLALLGLAQRYLNQDTSLDRFMKKHSYNVYVLHYSALIYAAYGTSVLLHLPAGVCYALTLTAGTALTFLLDALFSRIPVFRFLVLGIHRYRN